MSYYGVYILCVNFVKFGGQTLKNIHDVRKMCLEIRLCVSACFIEFYGFIFNETHMGGPKLLYQQISVGNVKVRLHVRLTWGPKGGPNLELNTVR